MKERRRKEVIRYKEKRKKYWKEYFQRPEVKEKIRKRETKYRKTNKNYAIADRLRRSLLHALNKYSKTGKIMSSKKYGLDWKKIIEWSECGERNSPRSQYFTPNTGVFCPNNRIHDFGSTISVDIGCFRTTSEVAVLV